MNPNAPQPSSPTLSSARPAVPHRRTRTTSLSSFGVLRKSHSREHSTSSAQSHSFHMSPPEIYDSILEQLRIVHSDPLSTTCATCYSRDLHSIALTARRLY